LPEGGTDAQGVNLSAALSAVGCDGGRGVCLGRELVFFFAGQGAAFLLGVAVALRRDGFLTGAVRRWPSAPEARSARHL
jgi:hypothetical protein